MRENDARNRSTNAGEVPNWPEAAANWGLHESHRLEAIMTKIVAPTPSYALGR
jgi:hypothetical protein